MALRRIIVAFAPLWLAGCVSARPVAGDRCDAERLRAVAVSARSSADHLLALADCLGDPSPAVRDGFAYERFAGVLRSGDVAPATLRALVADLSPRLRKTDADGFEAPFAALVLSEVARVDRVAPYLDDVERSRMVAAAAEYLVSVTDYRGFIEGQGWRHGVAHASDFAMQLSLNPKLSREQGGRLLAAIGSQVAPSPGHSYVFGEPGRLARPVYFLMLNGRVDNAASAAFFEAIAPDDSARWQAPYRSTAGLAALHNTRAFAQSLFVYASASDDPRAGAIADAALSLLRALP